jgi:hypothetical protein
MCVVNVGYACLYGVASKKPQYPACSICKQKGSQSRLKVYVSSLISLPWHCPPRQVLRLYIFVCDWRPQIRPKFVQHSTCVLST